MIPAALYLIIFTLHYKILIYRLVKDVCDFENENKIETPLIN